jgi:hypothetical protein
MRSAFMQPAPAQEFKFCVALDQRMFTLYYLRKHGY